MNRNAIIVSFFVCATIASGCVIQQTPAETPAAAATDPTATATSTDTAATATATTTTPAPVKPTLSAQPAPGSTVR